MLLTALLTIVCILLITCTSPVLVNVAVLRKFLFSLLSILTGVMCYSQQFESYTRAFRATCPWFSHQQLWNLHIKWKFILTRIFFFFDTFHCALNYTVTLEIFAPLKQSQMRLYRTAYQGFSSDCILCLFSFCYYESLHRNIFTGNKIFTYAGCVSVEI